MVDLPEQWRTYRLCTLLHCTPSALEDESAVELDWLLAIDGVIGKVRADQMRKNNAG